MSFELRRSIAPKSSVNPSGENAAKESLPAAEDRLGFPLVLLICDSNPFSIVRYFEHALYECVNLVTVYLDVHEWFLKRFGLPRLLYKLFKTRLRHLGPLPREPDVVLVVEPYVKTRLELDRFKDSVKVFYALDPHSPKAREAYARCGVWGYDYVFCGQKDYIPMLEELGCSRVHWLPYAVDPSIFRKLEDVGVKYDVAFLGSLTPDRRTVLERLGSRFKLLTVGHGKGACYMHDASIAYSMSRIVLQVSNRGTLGARVFEGMACNRLVVADKIDNGLNDLFVDGRDIVLYGELEELEERVDYYLSHEEERKRIAVQGYNIVIDKHTYKHRITELLTTVLGSSLSGGP
ncbi:MAG: glycosyltransferase [Candidatus Bathyarchaeia archaeon]